MFDFGFLLGLLLGAGCGHDDPNTPMSVKDRIEREIEAKYRDPVRDREIRKQYAIKKSGQKSWYEFEGKKIHKKCDKAFIDLALHSLFNCCWTK